MLCNSTNSGSVVGACVDGRHSVDTCREAVRNIGTEDTADSRSVQTLEEREGERVEDFRRFKRLHLLNNNAAGSHQDQFSTQFDANGEMSYWECATKIPCALSC